MEIVIASKNVHKIRELRALLNRLEKIDVTSLLNFSDYKPSQESGKTFEENAKTKALEAAKALKRWVLADDSGLVVPALQGEPGIFSKRYAGDDATDSENRSKILKAMSEKQGLERAAYYECCLALAGPDGQLKKYARGICEGYLSEVDKGSNGFGYDALFIKHDYDKTFAELEESLKSKISHRGKALEKILPYLESIAT